jgi:preprotein translocase subunit SecG
VFGVLLAILILDGLFLTVIVLLQAGKGGGLAAMGGSGGTAADSLIGGRQAATLLTKATWTAGGLFLTLALVLSVLSSRRIGTDSILRDEFQTAPVTPQPVPLPGTQPAGPEAQPGGTGATPPATTGSGAAPQGGAAGSRPQGS